MRVVLQRVSAASVTIGDELLSSIKHGVCLLVGLSTTDTPADIDYMWVNEGACSRRSS